MKSIANKLKEKYSHDFWNNFYKRKIFNFSTSIKDSLGNKITDLVWVPISNKVTGKIINIQEKLLIN